MKTTEYHNHAWHNNFPYFNRRLNYGRERRQEEINFLKILF